MIRYLLFIALFGTLVLVTIPFSGYMNDRPVALKLGYTPRAEVLKIVSGEHRYLVASTNVIRVLFYFGSLNEEYANRNLTPPEYARMYETLIQSVKLDPYNQDLYYFAQATFTWDVGRIKEVNKLLEYGMKYRVDDFNLPFWAGFNTAYFLKDYDKAAAYMQKAAEISNSPFFTKLAARFFHEAGRNDLGIAFLDTMIRTAKDRKIKDSLLLRKRALAQLRNLQQLVDRFHGETGLWPETIDTLKDKGYLDFIPADPYGGVYIIEPTGTVKTTSNLTFSRDNEKEN
ncbi:MAG: hypothetical protein C0623_00685 [Desulfuromonas sp.]|nr:MAG: hypothetical protein C0623_00685 [Desulfuromonas sp.]